MESNEIVARGHFWLRDMESALAGELKYSPQSGATLYLFGTLEPIRSDNLIRYPIVRGRTEGLGWVWLLEALVTSQQLGTRPSASELHSNLVISSSSANDVSTAPILKLSAQIECFHNWLGVSGFVFKNPADFANLEVGFRSPKSYEFEVGDNKVAFEFGRVGPSMRIAQNEVTIRQTTTLSMIFGSPTRLEDAREKLLVVTDLLALGVGRSLSWSELDAKFAVVSTEPNGLWAKVFDKPIESRSHDEVMPWQMLFTFRDVEKRFQKVLSSWMAVANEAKPLYMLYSATTRATRIYSEHRLINFFQALESYHRIKNEVDEQTKQRIRSIKSKMLAACTDEEQKWVRDRLQHLHEPSAAERIKDLVLQFHAEWIFSPDWEKAVKRITGMRNYFTHYSREVSSENLDPANIYNDGSRLQVLCEQILLVEIGFSSNEAGTLLQGKGRLQRLTVS
jgi:hypothetical protein